MPTSKITINPGSLDPWGHLSWLVESLSRDSVLGRNWTILMPAHKILKNCPPFFIFKNSERVLRIDIGRWKFQKFIITYLSLPRKNLKTQLQLLLPLNFAYAKKLLEKRAIFVLLFEGTNFIQKFISISKNWPRLMKISESHQDISADRSCSGRNWLMKCDSFMSRILRTTFFHTRFWLFCYFGSWHIC